jgi:double-strand break repair protein MRE11
MHRTLDLFRSYCMGDAPCKLQVLSDQSINFKNRYGRVNYEDPDYNIGLPVFGIHGNHDDPTREGGDLSLSAMDLLSMTNLVNYFGKCDQVSDARCVNCACHRMPE